MYDRKGTALLTLKAFKQNKIAGFFYKYMYGAYTWIRPGKFIWMGIT